MSAQAFADLDAALPLALLPVRLEARYLPRDQPTELVVRIFPDVIHADAHAAALTEREERAGHAYWKAVWNQADVGAVTAAREWLAAQCGSHRALWVATATTPVGQEGTSLVFPELTPRTTNEPVRARLLPDRWMVRLYDAQLQPVHTMFGTRVPEGLAMAPALATVDLEAVDPVTGKRRDPLDAFLGDQGLDWMIDVAKAIDVGMAVRIPLAVVPNPVGALVVTGVRSERDALAEGDELDALLGAHWYSTGVDVVPQGTPTNNTDAGRSGVSVDSPDIDELFERETSERPMAPGGRAVLMAADSALMYRVPAADSVSLALGRVRANLLDRTAHAETLDGLAAWAMSLAIGYATLGDYLDGPLAMIDGRSAPGIHTPTLRDWYVDWVRGGGPLPVIRCGAHPYGLLPITTAPGFIVAGEAVDFRALLELHLALLVPTWERSLPIAALDPDATDGPPSTTPAADAVIVGEVLGAVPHPTSLQLRLATDHTVTDRARFHEIIAQIDEAMNPFPIEVGGPWAATYLAWRDVKPLIDGIPTDLVPDATPPDIATQIALTEEFRSVLAGLDDDILPAFTNAPALIDDDLMPLLEMHRDATDRIPSPLSGWSESGGIGSDAVIRLVHTTFDAEAEPVSRLITTDGDPAEIDELLGNLIDSLGAFIDPVATGVRQPVVTGPAPLLHHLLDQNHLQVPLEDAPRVRLALQTLRAGFNATTVANREPVFERVLRETLGLSTHRIDAWITSLASERLAAKRRQRPAGIQVGGYGWLLDLEPSDDPASQGFIHAHSLSHAATAAVLRSGWNAFGTDSDEAPLSIDLSSRRVRGAQWILDGVRNGQDLAETLGARFERYLHDDHLDVWIDTVRDLVLVVTAAPGPASAVVDGLLVARSWSGVEQTTVEQQLHGDLTAATAPTGDAADDAERDGVRRALARVAADLDSVADLTMAQSVHTMLRANLDAAAGALAVTGGGDATIPPITVTSSQRDSQLVSHRVVAVWPAGTATASDSVLAVAEPRLTAWLERLLPAAGRVSARVIVRDAGGAVVERTAVSLAEVGLTTVEAAHLAGASATQSASRLGRLMVAVAGDRAVDGRTVAVELGHAGSNDDRAVSIDEFGLLAGVAVDAVGRCRALRPEDLVVPGADPGEPVEDVEEIEERRSDVERRLTGLAADLRSADPVVVRRALVRCAAIDVPGAVVAVEAGDAADAVATVIAALAARRRPAPAEELTGTAVEIAVERLRRAVNGAIPILPVFTPPPDPARAISAAFERRVHEIDDVGHRWLRQAGRVRTALGAMNELLMLSETMLGGTQARYGLVQLPHHDEGWGAISQLNGHRQRLAVLSLTGVDAIAAEAQPIAGVLIDGWTEGIPTSDQLTGIAVHFDAPTARAPNAVLLSVVDEETGFSAQEISEQLLHAIHLAKLRAVPPTSLVEHGHYLPTIFLPDTVEPAEVNP